jgi:fluoroquinolone transport system ATP-binding protein
MIHVKNLEYRYPGAKVNALKGISFDVNRGEVFGFLGPSGAGKSTTQNLLIKLLDHYEGEIEIDGKPLDTFGSEYYERIGVGFELPNHFLKLTAYENLRFFASLYESRTRDLDELLKLVGLFEDKDKKVENFSKGMKMRLNFCRALINNAEILFLDEPTTGLDPVNAKRIKDLVLEEKKKGRTIIITTHNMQVADDLCDRVAFIVDGVIKELNEPKELKLIHGEAVVKVEYYDGEHLKTSSHELDTLSEDEAIIKIIKNYKIRRIHSQETTLEEVFIKVTGRGLD